MKTRCQIVSALVEGCSIRAICRMVGVSKGAVLRLIADLGTACDEYQDKAIRGLKSTKRVQCDEIWSFCYAKDRNVPKEMEGQPGVGSVWTWQAIDADSKLVITWLVGSRDQRCATRFMLDLASRVEGRIQLTTDAHKPYRWAVGLAFEDEVDFAQLIKKYAGIDTGRADAKYSPPVCCGVETLVRQGDPDLEHVSTSYVERSNLTMRMGMRRFTRLTNGFSKKLANLEHAVALHFMHYNFCRVHTTIKTTPAIDAGIADHVWSIAELVALIPEKRAALWGGKSRGMAIGSAAESE